MDIDEGQYWIIIHLCGEAELTLNSGFEGKDETDEEVESWKRGTITN